MIKIPTSYNLNQTLASICNLIAHPVFMLIAWQKPSLVVCISPPTLQGQPPVPGGKGQPTLTGVTTFVTTNSMAP